MTAPSWSPRPTWFANTSVRQAKRSKYGAVQTVVDGERFDSKSEAERWQELRLLERAGLITDLRRQVKFPLTINGREIGVYTADFVYLEKGERVVEDRKGFFDAAAKLRIKVAEACHDMTVRITRKQTKKRGAR